MNQIFLGEPSQEIKNWFIENFPSWPAYTTLEFVDGTTQTKEIQGAATWQNIGVKSYAVSIDNTLKSCQLGNKVTKLSSHVFYGCGSLTSINIPNSVSSIGHNTFFNCDSLPLISIPSSVISIETLIIQNCSSLTSITIDPNNKNYDSRNNCNSIIETSSNTLIAGCGNSTIPSSVTSIGRYGFSTCRNFNLSSINIPNSITSLDFGAFYSCKLLSITIPSSVISIGDYAFMRCNYLTLVNIQNSDKFVSIGKYAFGDCTTLTSINIPNSVTSIGASSFINCQNLSISSIPSSVIEIGNNAFKRCPKLTSIVFENRAISDITSMANYPWGRGASDIVPGIS